jgi:hypothetical protein
MTSKMSAIAFGVCFMLLSAQGAVHAQVRRMWTLHESGYVPVHNVLAYLRETQSGGTWLIELDGPLAIALVANSGGADAGEITVYEFDSNAPRNKGQMISSDTGFLGNRDHRPAVVLISPPTNRSRLVLVEAGIDVSVKFAK